MEGNSKESNAGLNTMTTKRTIYLLLALVTLGPGLWLIINMLIMLSRGGIIIGASLDLGTGLLLVVIGATFLVMAVRLHQKIQNH